MDTVADLMQVVIAFSMIGTLVAATCQLHFLRKQIKQQDRDSKSYIDLLAQQLEHQIQASKQQATLVSKQIEQLKNQNEIQYNWVRKEKALEYSLSKNQQLQQIRKDLDAAFGNIQTIQEPITMKEIGEKLKEDPSKYTVISALLAHWENLALAIELEIVDEKVAYEMTAGIVRKYVYAFQKFINDRRRNKNPRAYKYLLELDEKWAKKLQQGINDK